jgi:hypothetical protein
MSLFAKDVLSHSKGQSKENIIESLLDLKNYQAKTEIFNVLGMSAYDLVTFHLSTDAEKQKLLEFVQLRTKPIDGTVPYIGIGEYLYFLGGMVRINAISNRRGSRIEAVNALGFIPTQGEKDQKMIDNFFG